MKKQTKTTIGNISLITAILSIVVLIVFFISIFFISFIGWETFQGFILAMLASFLRYILLPIFSLVASITGAIAYFIYKDKFGLIGFISGLIIISYILIRFINCKLLLNIF